MIKFLLQKEFIQMRRNPFLPRLIFIFPIMIMCVMPWVMNMEVMNVRVVAVDHDRSAVSQRLTSRIAHSPYFVFTGMRHTYAAALADVERGRADVILEIPHRYGRTVEERRPAEVLVAANAVNGTGGALGASYLAQIVAQNLQEFFGAATPENISTLYLYNPRLDYKLFMIPALMSMLMVMLCGFLPALNIVAEKESGTIEQINVTPVGKSTFILAKLIPYWIVGMVVLTVCFALSWLVYGIVPAGSVPLLYLTSLLLALVFSGFGLVVSNRSDTMQQAMFVMWFFMVCMILLSGLFTPVASMPGWAQALTELNPMRHYIDAMRTVFVRGGGMAQIWPQLLRLAAFAAVFDAWAVLSYRKNS